MCVPSPSSFGGGGPIICRVRCWKLFADKESGGERHLDCRGGDNGEVEVEVEIFVFLVGVSYRVTIQEW